MDHGNQDLTLDLVHQIAVQAGGRRERTHPAGIGSFVMVEGTLIVLTGFQRNDRASVSDRQHARFTSVQAFLDDQAVTRLTKDPPDHDLIDRLQRLAQIVADVNPLACGQTIGFQDHAQRPPQHEVARFRGRC